MTRSSCSCVKGRAPDPSAFSASRSDSYSDCCSPDWPPPSRDEQASVAHVLRRCPHLCQHAAYALPAAALRHGAALAKARAAATKPANDRRSNFDEVPPKQGTQSSGLRCQGSSAAPWTQYACVLTKRSSGSRIVTRVTSAFDDASVSLWWPDNVMRRGQASRSHASRPLPLCESSNIPFGVAEDVAAQWRTICTK